MWSSSEFSFTAYYEVRTLSENKPAKPGMF